jgi:subtilisin family serine protease
MTSETVEAADAVQSSDPAVLAAKVLAMRIYSKGYDTPKMLKMIEETNSQIKYNYNLDFNSSTIVGDDPTNLKEIGYGNNDVTGPDAMHGTHVAGIIAANRDNNLGILGQADDVKIMVLRAVPNGDERDKDIANAIYFAVDHGASVINMSFGKEFSPQKARVDQAVAYAEKHGVILVHAAGNDSKNTEQLSE